MTIPWTPDDDEARRELNERIDSFDVEPAGMTLWERLINWLNEALTLNIDPAGTGNVIIQVLLIAAVGVLIFLLVRYFRPAGATAGSETGDQLADPTVTAQEYLAAAQRYLAAEQLDQAYLAAYRFMVRSAAQRGLVEVTPATTATTFGWSLGSVLPGYGQQIETASTEFNRIIYGGNTPSRDATENVLALANTVATVTPQPADDRTDPARLIPR